MRLRCRRLLWRSIRPSPAHLRHRALLPVCLLLACACRCWAAQRRAPPFCSRGTLRAFVPASPAVPTADATSAFYVRRKPLSATINTLANALYKASKQ